MSLSDHPLAIAVTASVGTLTLVAVVIFTAVIPTWVRSKDNDIAAEQAHIRELERQLADLQTERTRGKKEHEHLEEQKAQLDQQVRALQAKTATTPSEAERDNKQLRRDLEAEKANGEANQERVAQLESDVRALKKELEKAKTTPMPQLAATPRSSQGDQSPPRQRLERFIVEVARAQAHGESATVYVRFTSTVTSRTKMLLADGFLGSNKTFLVDDSGQHYDLDNSSGIGNCCFGFAGGDWNGGILDLEPKGIADVTLTFRRRNRAGELERQPQTFTLTAELTIGEIVKRQDWSSPQWQSSGSAGISVPGITPK